MSLSLDEILQCEERLQAEIAERECLLAVVKVMRGYAAKGQCIGSMDFSLVGSVLRLGAPKALIVESAPEQAATPSPKPAPLPPPKRYIHPELEELAKHCSSHVAIVKWAIGRITDDFSLQHIQQLLKREGYSLSGAAISTVLTRMKRNGEIDQTIRSRGPVPAIFRKPECASAAVDHTIEPGGDGEMAADAAAA